ncbi:MAG TPA: NADP-dependent oxidoreductase [Paludibaculum sp.]|jgi:NADPH:quinone reductase-like Zn-dependent oxidoreductase
MTSSLPQTMRAFAIDRFGEPGSLRSVPLPAIGPDDALVRVLAAGVNPIDLKIRDGKKPVAVLLPHVLGQDAAGVVVRVGDSVSRFQEGDAVYGAFWLAGAFAEYVRVSVPKAAIAVKPASLGFDHAAALPTPGLAALAAMHAIQIQRGETLLVVGATGGVGSFVVQLAARQGARVLVTARKESEEYARGLGAAQVFDHTHEDVVSSVKAVCPGGIDAIVDMVSGKDILNHVSTVLKEGGRLATTVHAADESAMGARRIQATNVDVFGSTVGLGELNRVIEEKNLVIPIERKFALADAADALAAIASGHTRGKIILTMNN